MDSAYSKLDVVPVTFFSSRQNELQSCVTLLEKLLNHRKYTLLGLRIALFALSATVLSICAYFLYFYQSIAASNKNTQDNLDQILNEFTQMWQGFCTPSDNLSWGRDVAKHIYNEMKNGVCPSQLSSCNTNRYLPGSYREYCCPKIYDFCANLLAIQNIPDFLWKKISLISGIVISSVLFLAEAINIILTDLLHIISKPHLLFFISSPLKNLSLAESENIRRVAAKYEITIIEDNLYSTLKNFKLALTRRGNSAPQEVHHVEMSRTT